MNLILKVALSCSVVTMLGLLATDQTAGQTTPSSRPEAAVRNLYREVVNRAPSGLIDDADMPIFAPYLSKSLRHKLDLAQACEKDWARQNRGQLEKAPFDWSEFGIFSGGNERISPGKFHVEKIRKAKDGSFQIVVGFVYRPVDGSGAWRVTDRVILEDGHFVLDDVLFPKEGPEHGYTLTSTLSEGCAGSSWVGLH